MTNIFRGCLLFCLWAVLGCKNENKGQDLAKAYCGACHLQPDPKLLDKNTWKNGVLPEMSLWMGMSFIESSTKYTFEEITKINDLGVLPPQQLMSNEDWKLINDYFINNAPEKLEIQSQNVHYHSLDSMFSYSKLPIDNNNEITLLKFDKSQKQLSIGSKNGELVQFDPKTNRSSSKVRLISPSTDILLNPDGTFGLTVAGRLEPNNDKSGFYVEASVQNGRIVPQKTIKALQRPVAFAKADLNQDGRPDVVISSFGHFAGRLSWFELPDKGEPVEHPLKMVAGASCVVIRDFNNDKLPDIMALFGQGNEGVFIFYNKGKGVFEENQVLQFPPVYGSLHIDLQDFNKDGFLDILYSNGDNGDASPILKPYHGIRIFLNDGKNHFTEKTFFQMYGVIKSLARDFDGDGDLDIAAISFFPDYAANPQKSFVYLKNEGDFKFKPYISAKTDCGRWMVMEAMDYDNDGDDDLLLGACYDSVRMGAVKTKTAKTSVLVLENKQKQ